MDLRGLRAFVTVAETLHFGRAAERLHIVQPAVTQQIQKLEAELSVQLFERGTRSVRLTSVGYEFLAEAQSTIEHAERALLVAARAQRGDVGRIELAHASSIAFSGVLSKILRTAASNAPDIAIGVTELDAEPQIQQLLKGGIDLALLRMPAGELPRELSVHTLYTEPVVACLPTHHPLSHDEVDVTRLRHEDFIGTHLREGFGFFDTQLRICRDAGFEPRIVARSHQFVSIASLVSAGRGVALMPASVRCLGLPGIGYYTLQGVERRTEIAMIWHGERLTPAIQRMIDLTAMLHAQQAFAP